MCLFLIVHLQDHIPARERVRFVGFVVIQQHKGTVGRTWVGRLIGFFFNYHIIIIFCELFSNKT